MFACVDFLFFCVFLWIRLVTEKEKKLLLTKQYTDIVNHQKVIDAEIDIKVGNIFHEQHMFFSILL
jgi:hypothetical protein